MVARGDLRAQGRANASAPRARGDHGPPLSAIAREAGVDARTVSLADLPDALPVLTKAEVQRDLRSFISPAVPSRKHLIEHTSGTTGGGLRFPTTWQAHRELWATWWRYRGWHGITHGTWCAQLAGHVVVSPDRDAPPFWRYNLAGRQILMSGYHLSPENIPAYVAELRKRRPPWIHGYPSLIALVAQHLVEQGAELGYQLRAVTTGAESLFPQQRELMRTRSGSSHASTTEWPRRWPTHRNASRAGCTSTRTSRSLRPFRTAAAGWSASSGPISRTPRCPSCATTPTTWR